MIVRCIKIINEQSGEILPATSWLTVGKTYPVLAVFVAANGLPKYRLLGDDEVTPALHTANQFEILSGILPSIWRAHSVPNRYFELAPTSWIVPGFWEAFFDGNPDAVRVFHEDYRTLLQEAADEGLAQKKNSP